MLVGEVFARMGLDSKQYEKNLGRLEGVTQKQANTLGGIFKNAFSVALGMGVFEAVKRGFRAVVGESISFNAQMEQARIGFTTMLGSAERAQVFLDDMAKFAAKTPFEFPELLDASKRMLAYGFAAKDVLPTMEAVGNASAAVGLGTEGINRIILALGQMRAKGKLSAEEMRQLTETGIPAWEILAEAMGKTTAEIMDMQSKGLIPADRAIKMLVEGMNKRFPNMMAQMENTWEGVTSTIKDIWKMTIGAVTQNLFQGVVSWLQKVRDFAVGFYDTFQKYGLQRAISESFGPEVAAMVSVLGATLRGLASVVSAVTGFITQYGKQIRFVAVVMGTYLVLLKTVTLAKWLATVATTALTNSQLLLAGQSSATTGIIGFLSNVITFYKVQMLTASATTNVFTGALVRLRAALYAVWTALGPIGWAILGLSVAVGVGMNIWNKYKSALQQAKMQGSLAAIEEQTKKLGQSSEDAAAGTDDLTDATKKASKAAGKNLQSFDEVHQLQEDMAGSAEDLAKSMGLDVPEVEGLEDLFDVAAPDLSGIQVSWKEILSAIWDDVKEWAGNLWEGVKEKWNGFTEWVKAWGIWSWMSEKWEGLKTFVGNLWEGVKTKWEGFKGWVAGWAVPLWDGVKNTWSNFKEFAADMWDGAKEKWSGFKEFAGTTWDGIKATVQEKWNTLKTEAPIVWDNIKTTIAAKWNELRTNAPIVWGNVKDAISTKWEELKIAAPLAWGSIKDSVAAKWAELRTSAPVVWEGIRSEISTRWNALKTEAPIAWENIKQSIVDRFNATKTSVIEAARNIRDNVPKSWDEMLGKLNAAKDAVRKAIVEPFTRAKETILGIIDDAKNWGKNLMSNITDGIKSKVNSVKTAVSNAASAVKNFLGFSSPTREGPGRDADRWAPNLMKMYAQGILGNAGLIQSAANEAAKGLAAMNAATVLPTTLGTPSFASSASSQADSSLVDGIEQAVFRAMSNVNRFSQAAHQSSAGGDKEIVLRIDGTAFARLILPAIIKEGQRQGLDLVVRPQGV